MPTKLVKLMARGDAESEYYNLIDRLRISDGVAPADEMDNKELSEQICRLLSFMGLQNEKVIVFGGSYSSDDDIVLKKAIFRSPDWIIDSVSIGEQEICASGWYVDLVDHPAKILVNGIEAEVELYKRPDVEAVFDFLRPEREPRAFVLKAKNNGDYEYRFELIGTAPPTFWAHYFPSKMGSRFPLPQAERIQRVNGTTNSAAFLRTGYTNYKTISNIFRRYIPNKSARILDWGCGCGSLARYFLSDDAFTYNGCDIDFDNIEWCKSNMAPDAFWTVPTVPPQDVCGQIFDGIFGISVISHLSENNISAWKNWLHSSLRPGGVLILTTLGLQAAAKCNPETLCSVLENGILFFEDDHPIGKIIGDKSFYGTSFQTPHYMEILFRDMFEFVEYNQAGFGHQDILIFKRR